MAYAQPTKVVTVPRASFGRLARRAMAVAAGLFPLLILAAALVQLLDSGEFVAETYEWRGGSDVERFALQWLAWYAAIPAMLGVASLLMDRRPRLTFVALVFVMIGAVTQASWNLLMFYNAALTRVPFEPYHTLLPIDQSPVFAWGISVLLWMIGLTMLGIGLMRADVLPRWVGALLIVGTLGFFLYQGPGGLLAPVVPLVGYPVAGICFLLAFSMVAARLWRSPE